MLKLIVAPKFMHSILRIPYWKLSEYYNELVNLLRFTKIILKSMPKYVEVAVNFPRKRDEMKIYCR